MPNPDTTVAIDRNPLNDFADRWALDGDLIRCRRCNRGQHTSWAHHDFQHAAGCRNEQAEGDPWKVLLGMINAQIMKAQP
jgi:hypothetical protein